ncbi:MAG: hypothetical protein ACRCSO_10025, partial [Sphingomonas sp.]
MATSSDFAWFKTTFGAKIAPAIHGTPFTIDMLAAIACQETGDVWVPLRRQGMAVAEILRLCVGDTIDAKPGGGGRQAFPRTKKQLVAHQPNGQQMFDVARQALVDMAAHIHGYGAVAANPDKFCHAFGIFQYDLQFFDLDQAYFMSGGYADFDKTLAKWVMELKDAAARLHLPLNTPLTDAQIASIAIAYNTGGYDPKKGLKQGYKDS